MEAPLEFTSFPDLITVTSSDDLIANRTLGRVETNGQEGDVVYQVDDQSLVKIDSLSGLIYASSARRSSHARRSNVTVSATRSRGETSSPGSHIARTLTIELAASKTEFSQSKAVDRKLKSENQKVSKISVFCGPKL